MNCCGVLLTTPRNNGPPRNNLPARELEILRGGWYVLALASTGQDRQLLKNILSQNSSAIYITITELSVFWLWHR